MPISSEQARLNGQKKKGHKASHTLEAQEAKKVFIDKVSENVEPIAQVLVDKALKGDVSAAREVLDRAWGRPLQQTEITGKDGKDLFSPSEKLKQIANELITRNSNPEGDSTSS